MLSEDDSLREFGGAELLRCYPDRGLISDSNWYQASLSLDPEGHDEIGRLDRLAIRNRPFLAVLSANADGFRVFVGSEQFAIFVPWSEATVTAERVSRATRIHVRTAEVRWLGIVLTLDDRAADDLFYRVAALPPRAARLYSWTEPWTWPAIATIALLGAALIWIVVRG